MKALSCDTDARREAIRRHDDWNGLDFVEVDTAQTTVTVFFLGKAPAGIRKEHVTIEGGRSARDRVRVLRIDVRRANADYVDDRVLVRVDKPGDYSTYTLRLTGLDRIDPRYAAVDFSFKANCPTDVDCQPACGCEPQVFPAPAIDYLAKDYASFRRLMLDRLSLICPDWRERHAADLGIALVEILAYAGDSLSYYQDAVATEAYLATARRRPSVRRHARLVDYVLSEGCNARALVAIETDRDIAFKAADVRFVTGVAHLLPVGDRAALPARALERLAPDAYDVFEPLHARSEIKVWKANNRIRFYTWGGRECCLRKGATSATLRARQAFDKYDKNEVTVRLRPGALLIFEEVVGPKTGHEADADPRHRHAVRLTTVRQSRDELEDEDLIEIEWSEEDALPFDLCLSAVTAPPECEYREDISVARGNVVLVDHGRSVGPEDLGTVPVRSTSACCECEGEPSVVRRVPGRYRPRLAMAPLTFVAPVEREAPATTLLAPDARRARPAVTLSSSGNEWTARLDLLSSSGADRHFVVEMEEDGVANLRFGDGELGKQAPAGAAFTAMYRIGNGPSGNVGAAAISLLVHRDSDLGNDIVRVWNPLPATGGTAPEPMTEAKLNAPFAFRAGPESLQRAITPGDYARIAERHAKIQRAAARLVWTGSWFEAEVGIDVKAAYGAQQATIAPAIERHLEDYRRIGHDLDVRPAAYIPLDVRLHICVAPEYQAGHIKAALLDALSSRVLSGGGRGAFHADRLTFGDDIYLSALIATAQALPGVVSVDVSRLQRQLHPSNQEIENGVLPLGPFEIAQLDNDPNHPDHGRLEIVVSGGR